MHPRIPLIRLAPGLGVLLCTWACVIETEQPEIQGTTVRLTVLHTSDIHSRLFPYELQPLTTDQNYGLYGESSPYGGVERVAALIERERGRADRVIHLDTGDPFQGAPIFNFSTGEPEFRWLSAIKADLMVVGNHEFDMGTANLTRQAEAWINFPFLAANYIFDNWSDPRNVQLGRLMQAFVVLNVKGLRVAIIGIGDISSIYSITEGGNSTGITPVEANETVRAYLEFLRPAADLMVVATHLGLTEDQELIYGHEMYFKADADVSDYLTRKDDPWVQVDCPECEAGNVKYFVPGVRGIDAIFGGHLHVLLHPPMVLTDPAGRKVVLEHPGAFAKYLTRTDLAVAVPAVGYTCDTDLGHCTPSDAFGNAVSCTQDADCTLDKVAPYDAEIVGNQHQMFPIDSLWCAEPRPPDPYDNLFPEWVESITNYCNQRGHGPSRELLEPYRLKMETDPRFDLTRVFGYAPKVILRRNSGTGGDSPLGNMTAASMMRRKRVEAEFGVTNTLGIRDNLYPGLINLETVFNVFPFENIITVMYLSGREVQELFDYVTERSGGRGCQSQAQIAGCAFTMNCGQDLRNQAHYPCTQAADCCAYRSDIKPCDPGSAGTAIWECNQGSCYSHPAEDITISGQALDLNASYKMATNDYIAKGGSGFKVLKRNTTKVYTGIAMRDALVEYLSQLKTCEELLAGDPNVADAFALSFCLEATENPGKIVLKGSCLCEDLADWTTRRCSDPATGETEACSEISIRCGAVSTPMLQFCGNPLKYPIIVGAEDGRIRRKVK